MSALPGRYAPEVAAEPARLALRRELAAIRLPVVYRADAPAEAAECEGVECEGAQTLRLVEQAVQDMQDLRARADTISAQALDLIHLTHQERAQLQVDVERAREEAATWERQARASAEALGEAARLVRQADHARHELEVLARRADLRAEAAEARVANLEHYLKEIRAFLEARMMLFR